MAPSGPETMRRGVLDGVGIVNSVIVPDGVIRPILLPVYSVNHRLPSKPAVIAARVATLLAVGTGNSMMAPVVVMRPILLAAISTNHRLPSGPAQIPVG